MKPLVALDWGTSALRAARLGPEGQVLEERHFDRGILTVPPGGFPGVFEACCGDWMREPGAVALVAGMAGSRQGWIEAPYCACPASIGDVASRVAWAVPGRVAIVPGLSCEHASVPDVMRGEETQVFGALQTLGRTDATLVLPGTHSKWVTARGGRIERFETSMTGEFYALLRRQSILARTMPPDDADLVEPAFLRGLKHAAQAGNLLRGAFSARTLSLFGRLADADGPSYLSGLVIGEELRCAPVAPGEPVVVVGSDALSRRYALALRARGVEALTPGPGVVWHGLAAIARQMRDMP